MRVSIETDGQKKEVEIARPTGFHQERYLKYLSELMKHKGDMSVVLKFLELKYEMITELCKEFKTIDDVKKLPIEEIDKLFEPIEDKFKIGRDEKLKN